MQQMAVIKILKKHLMGSVIFFNTEIKITNILLKADVVDGFYLKVINRIVAVFSLGLLFN